MESGLWGCVASVKRQGAAWETVTGDFLRSATNEIMTATAAVYLRFSVYDGSFQWMNIRLASLAGGLAVTLAAASPGEEVRVSKSTFASGGHSIDVEVFTPSSPGLHPAILLLYGAGGVLANNAFIRNLGPAFVACGCTTYLVHYFDRTGDTWASDDRIRTDFETWISTITDAISFIATQPGVDRERIATFGYSLGAYLAVAEASRDPRVRAVIELSGGIDPRYAAHAEHMPPLLILHGEEDQRVEVGRAHELEALMRKLGTPYEMRIYPKDGHVLGPLSAMDALLRGIAFLKRYITPEWAEVSPETKGDVEKPPALSDSDPPDRGK